jgi:hypothetical protein
MGLYRPIGGLLRSSNISLLHLLLLNKPWVTDWCLLDHPKEKNDNKTSIHAIHNLKESVLFKKNEKILIEERRDLADTWNKADALWYHVTWIKNSSNMMAGFYVSWEIKGREMVEWWEAQTFLTAAVFDKLHNLRYRAWHKSILLTTKMHITAILLHIIIVPLNVFPHLLGLKGYMFKAREYCKGKLYQKGKKKIRDLDPQSQIQPPKASEIQTQLDWEQWNWDSRSKNNSKNQKFLTLLQLCKKKTKHYWNNGKRKNMMLNQK